MGLELLDGVAPREIVRAASEAEVVDAMKSANDRGDAVAVGGGGTRMGAGDPLTRYDVGLDLSALRGVVEYEPDDLVATVRAGTTLAELAETFSPRRQRWPVEAGGDTRATVGGTLASAAWGASRLRYFHPRDWVIGARAVLGDATPMRSGGKVVKNVTGYDLTRLWSGTFGTLAAIVELTLKLTAVPERTVTYLADVDVATALAASADLHLAGLPLDGLALVVGGSARTLGAQTDSALAIRLAGPAAAVRTLGRAVRERVRCRDVANEVWARIADLAIDAKWCARIAWPAGAAPALEFAGYDAVVYPTSGVAYLLRSIDRGTFRTVRTSLEAVGGYAVLERATADYKRAVGGAWGSSRTPPLIARALKERFDPRDVLAPGRMPV